MQTETTTTTTPTPPAEAGTPAAPAGTPGQSTEAGKGTSLLGTATTAAPTATQTEGGAGQPPGGKPTGEAPQVEYQLKLPEGFVADEKAMGVFKALASESGVKPEGAQKLLEFYAEQTRAMSASLAQKQVEAHEAEVEAWAKQVREDKEVGGANFNASLQLAKSAAVRFCSPGLLDYFNRSGLGNHPEFVKAFVRIGKAIAEDSIRGASPAGGEGSQEAVYKQLYPTMFKE